MQVTPDELIKAHAWCAADFESGDATALPFSFVYDGKPSPGLLAGWPCERKSRPLDDQRTEYTLTFSDPQTGLVLRCVAVEYHDFPVVEWTLYFKNTGPADSPILENIQALDVRFERGEGSKGEFLLRTIKGDYNTADSYEPLEFKLAPRSERCFAPEGGRPTNREYPYWNLGWDGGGAILVLGWPGQWAARFVRDEARGVRVIGGQELTHFKLQSGEEVRSPLALIMFYQGEWIRSQNMWRRWIVTHNMPRAGGQLPPPVFLDCVEGHFDFQNGEAEMRESLDGYLAHGLRLTHYLHDAGWYPFKKSWFETGTWEIDLARFPNQFKSFSAYLHSKGIEFVVWFEPERVTPGTWLYDGHPEWLLKRDRPDLPEPYRDWCLLDLGNPEARAWMTDHVDRMMTEQGIDLYRQDFNIDPLEFWRANDTEDRQGITEIRYVCGYLAYWEELLRRRPGMIIDSCASGGRRDDLETLRRGVIMLSRSDYQSFKGDPSFAEGNQGHTYGLSQWMPYQGQGNYFGEHFLYASRSHMCLGYGLGLDVRRTDIDWAAARQVAEDWEKLAPQMYGDFYPLTQYSLDERAWMAWQFDSPEKGEGAVQAFRHAHSPFETAFFPLRGLDAGATYEMVDLDTPDSPQRYSGQELALRGLPVSLPDGPQAAIFVYRKIEG